MCLLLKNIILKDILKSLTDIKKNPRKFGTPGISENILILLSERDPQTCSKYIVLGSCVISMNCDYGKLNP